MTTFLRALGAATITVILSSTVVWAQGAVSQSGTVIPHHAGMWGTKGVLMDAGPASGGNANVGISELPIVGLGKILCLYDAPVTNAQGYHQLCLGANVDGNAAISLEAGGGSTSNNLIFKINGVDVPIGAPGPTGPSAIVNPLQYGAVGDGVVDDTAAVQAAMNAANHADLYLGPHIYAINATGLTCNGTIHMVGTQANQAADYVTVSGFRPLVPNMTILKIPDRVCDGSHFEHFGLDMGSAGHNTSGAAISMNETTDINNIVFSDIHMNRPCIGLDLNGNTIKVDRMQITQISGTGCGGIRIGHYTIESATVDPAISNTTIQGCGPSWAPCNIGGVRTPASWGMRIEDSGGLHLYNNDILFTLDGTVFHPAGSQTVVWTFCSSSVLGDTVVNSPLVIETGVPTANAQVGIASIFSQGCWGAAYLATGTAPGILISNTGNAPIFAGFNFSGFRLLSVPSTGIYVKGNTSYGTITGSIAAGVLTVTATSVPIVIQSQLSGVGVPFPAIIGFQTSGTPGGTGTYGVLIASGTTVASESMTLTGPQPSGFVLDGGSTLCGMGDAGSPADAGIRIGNGVYNYMIRNSVVKGFCDNSSSGQMINTIILDGNNWGGVVTGNDFEAFTTGQAFVGKPVQPDATIPQNGSVIKNNKGIDDQFPAFNAAASVDFGVYPLIKINGATPVSTLQGCWGGAKISIIPTGGLNFAAGGNIASGNLPLTPASNVMVEGTAINTPGGVGCQWYLK